MSNITLLRIKMALQKWCDEEKTPDNKDKKYHLCDHVWDNIKQFLGIGKYLPDDWEKYPPNYKLCGPDELEGYPIDDDEICTCSYCEEELDRNHFSDDEWKGSTDVWYQIILLYTTLDHPMGGVSPYPWYVHFCKRCCSLRDRWPKYFETMLLKKHNIHRGPFKEPDLFYRKHYDNCDPRMYQLLTKYFAINTSENGKLLRSTWSSLDRDDY